MASQKIFDAHLHIIDPRFPLIANAGFTPEPFSCDRYLQRLRDYSLVGGAVVSGSFQGFDQTYLSAALARLGPTFVGVTQVPESVTDAQVLALARAGVRAVRFNLKRGGSAAVTELDNMARRLHELAGWHVELYADAVDLAPLFTTLVSLPALCIDHLGLSKAGFPTLLKLVERGVSVKASGFGRVDFAVPAALRALFAANPDALLFGTDLPSTRAPRPFLDQDIACVREVFDESAQRKVLFENGLRFYRVS